MALKPTTKVWRYMSFAKFVWMLQTKQLWLTNARFFSDNWEVMFDQSQIKYLLRYRYVWKGSSANDMTLSRASLEDIKQYIDRLRNEIFISCWSASEHESHALWRLYCPTSEGVAIQTTYKCLKKSVEPLPVLEVTYTPIKPTDSIHAHKLATQKRPMFSYEQEVRVVLRQDLSDHENPERTMFGTGLPWNLEEHIENIWIHPEAQPFFAECVTDIVKLLAPKLGHQVWWSKMNTAPPF